MPKFAIDLTVTFTTPPSVGAGGVSGTLADKVVTRNAFDQFVIPASQLKGKLRHACEQLLRSYDVPLCQPPRAENMCPQFGEQDGEKEIPKHKELNSKTEQPRCLLCQIFGSSAFAGKLRFADLVATQVDLPDETLRQMVSLNRRRRTAEDKRLFLIETAPHFAGLAFSHHQAISGHLENEQQLHLLLAGLKMLFAWGGSTSRGLGWGMATFNASWDGRTMSNFEKEEVRSLCQLST